MLDHVITEVINDKDVSNEYNRVVSSIQPVVKGLHSLSATFEDLKEDMHGVQQNAVVGAISASGQEAEKTTKYEQQIDHLKDQIVFQDACLEQIDLMEKMERLLFEIENLMKKHQDQQFIKKELRDSFDSKMIHESYLTHAQAKLD